MEAPKKDKPMDKRMVFDAGNAGRTGERAQNADGGSSGAGKGADTAVCFKTAGRLTGRHRARPLHILLAALITLIILICAADISLRKPLRALAVSRVRAASEEALNDAVLKITGENGSGKVSMTNLLTNGNGSGYGVYAMEINSSALNYIAASIAHEAQELIRTQGKLGIGIPAGTATGITLFSGLGPEIDVTFTPLGSVASKINTKFSGAGINQTRYCAYLSLEAKVHLVLGNFEDTVAVSHTAALYEAVIIGAVPEAYTNVDSVDEALNLIPAGRENGL